MEQVTISLDSNLKKRIEETLSSMELTWEEFLTQVMSNYSLISQDMKEAMDECDDIIKNPENHKFYTDLDELFDDLDKACENDEI